MTGKTKLFMIALAVLTLLAGLPVAATASAADAAYQRAWQTPRISIVWPHNGAGVFTPVARSKAVNVSVWPSAAVSCTAAPETLPVLWQAANNEPAAPVDIEGEFFMREASGVKFPSLEYNTVPADIASNPSINRFYFMMGGWEGNVWVDAADARTYLPHPRTPAGFSEDPAPAQVDTRIQIVYPHDRDSNFVSVADATLVNVAVDIFEHGTLNSVPMDYNRGPIVLYIAEANYPMGVARADAGSQTVVATAHLEPYTVGDVEYPRWVFNNVKVEPGKQYHYLVRVHGAETFPTLWTHASDARTYLPHPEPPPACR